MKKIKLIILIFLCLFLFQFSLPVANYSDILEIYTEKQKTYFIGIGLEPNHKILLLYYPQNIYLDNTLGYSPSLTIELYNKDSQLKNEITLGGYDTAFKYGLNNFNAMKYEQGDYFKFKIHSDEVGIKVKNFRMNTKKRKKHYKDRYYIMNDEFIVFSETPPTLLGVEDITITTKDKLNLKEGIEAHSFINGTITEKVNYQGFLKYGIVGKYKIIYNVKDEGMRTIKDRIITIVPPIEGIENKTVNLGESFNSLEGVVARNHKNEDITDKLKVIGDVDTTKVGRYEIFYIIYDKDCPYDTKRIIEVVNPTPTIRQPMEHRFKTNKGFKYYSEKDNYFKIKNKS